MKVHVKLSEALPVLLEEDKKPTQVCGQRENPNCDPGKKAEVKTRGLCRSLSGKTGQGDRWQEDEE